MRGMISSIHTIDNATSQIAHQLNPPASPPSPLEEWEEVAFYSGYGGQGQNAERRPRNTRTPRVSPSPQAHGPEHARTASNLEQMSYPPPPNLMSHNTWSIPTQRPNCTTPTHNRHSTSWSGYSPAWSSSTPLSLLNRVVATYNVGFISFYYYPTYSYESIHVSAAPATSRPKLGPATAATITFIYSMLFKLMPRSMVELVYDSMADFYEFIN